MSAQLDLLSYVEPLPSEVPSGRTHRLVLAALRAEGARGLTAEEVASRCRIAHATTAGTRLLEMSGEAKGSDRERFPIPLVCRSATKERPYASGVRAYVWWLTDYGKSVAEFVEGMTQ